MNAVTDALGLKEFNMPATPSRVWGALQAQR
jgi:CO/xanthine dehydrogenase Mo-binding subunit